MSLNNLKSLVSLSLSVTSLWKIKCSGVPDLQPYIYKNKIFFCLSFLQEKFASLFSYNDGVLVPWLMAYMLIHNSQFVLYF